jgi:hypothetical protein
LNNVLISNDGENYAATDGSGEIVLLDELSVGAFSLIKGDFDGDGVIDIFAQSVDGGKHFFLLSNGGTMEVSVLTDLQGYPIEELKLSAIDGDSDGVDELLIETKDGERLFLTAAELKSLVKTPFANQRLRTLYDFREVSYQL